MGFKGQKMINNDAPFVHVKDGLKNAYDGFTPSKLSSGPVKNWEDANYRRYYAPSVRLKAALASFDAWWHRHPILVGVAGAAVIIVGIIAAVNLELGRPWF